MGVFPLPTLNLAPINMIYVRSDPWVLPPANQIESRGDMMPFECNNSDFNLHSIFNGLKLGGHVPRIETPC